MTVFSQSAHNFRQNARSGSKREFAQSARLDTNSLLRNTVAATIMVSHLVVCTARSFSTKGLSGAAALGAWHDCLEQAYYRLDVEIGNTERVRGELEELRLGDLSLSRFSADQQRVSRPKAAAAADSGEYYGLIFPRRQQLYFEQRGKSGFLSPGSVVITRSSERYECACPDDFQNVTIRIPAAVLERRVRGMDDLCATVVVGNEALVRIIGNMVDELVSSRGELLTHSASDLSAGLISLIGVMLDGPASTESSRVQHALSAEDQFRKICAYIRSHLSDVDLNPLGVAQSRRISLRHLHGLFQMRGTTFGRWLLEERLVAARQLMEDRESTEMTILELAYKCGFVSQSHFSTRYHERFQERPRDTLRRIRQSALRN